MDPTLPPFACRHTPALAELLHALGCSVLLTSYQSGKVILLSSDGARIEQLPRNFDDARGIALDGPRMAVASRAEIVFLRNVPDAALHHPKSPGKYDTLFAPIRTHRVGRVDPHDLAFGRDGLIGVATAFSCLFRLDDDHSLVPLWKPPFVSALQPDDRCHLNGLAMEDGVPRYATALGATDTAGGWRPNKLAGGVLIDVVSGEIVADGLAMPHSPRLWNGRLFLLLAATGEVVECDRATGAMTSIARVRGFARGLGISGDYLFVGTSRLRASHTFGDLPLARPGASRCGISVVHLPTGAFVGDFEYLNTCEEIYDVHVLAGIRRPGILGARDEGRASVVVLPGTSFWAAPDS